jgi:hypothetical protein
MPNEEGRRTEDVPVLIKTLAFYVQRDYPLEWHEAPVRGGIGTADDSRRSISFTIQDRRAFDAVRWT